MGVRWIDRVHLKRQIGDARQRAVPLQRGYHLIWRAQVHVESADQAVERRIGQPVAAGAHTLQPTAQPGRGEVARLLAVLADKRGARPHDARCHPWRQRRQISVNDRILQFVQRQVRRVRGARLRARQHQAVTGAAGPFPSTENVACQTRCASCGAAGYSRLSSPPNASARQALSNVRKFSANAVLR